MKLSLILISISFLFYSCSTEPPSYSKVLQSKRAFKDIEFKGEDSPIPKELRSKFKGLEYFNPDSSFKIIAKLSWDFNVGSSQLYKEARDDSKHYPVAKLEFNLLGKDLVLIGFSDKLDISKSVFVPFYDKTSGKTTYGGGRYVDAKVLNENQVEIDFNLAYNPYCVYNSNYVCAIPPFDNDLEIEILAGEKLPLIDEH